MSDGMRGLDAWITRDPPEPEPTVCPKCGKDSELAEDLEVIGLDRYGLLKYPLKVSAKALDLDYGDPDKLVSLAGASRAKQFATHVALYKCDCGAVLSEDGFVPYGEFHGYPEDNIPDDYLGPADAES